MRFPVRLLRGRWPAAVERRLARFVWQDPRVVLEDAAAPADYSAAMAAFSVGSTIKITGTNRHPAADSLLTTHLDLSHAVIADIGASDGTTSAELIAQLPAFGQYVIADLFNQVGVVELAGGTVFFDHEDNPVLVVGRRLLAWPGTSPLVRVLCTPWLRAARGRPRRQVPLLNPRARDLVRNDERVNFVQHDVFTPWPGPAPDVIKVANVLRRLYFSDEQIAAGLRTLLASLPEGGHLLMVDNARAKVPPRGGLYRREHDRFVKVAQTEDPAEVDDLVLATRLTMVTA